MNAKATWAATGSAPGQITLWKLDSAGGDPLVLGDTSEDSVTAITMPNESSLAMAGFANGVLLVFGIEGAEVQFRDRSPVQAVATSGTGRKVISGHEDGSLKIWNRDSWHTGSWRLADPVTALAVTGNGDTAIAADAKGSLWAWALPGDKPSPPTLLERPGHSPSTIAFSRDGTTACALDGESVVVWTVNSGKQLRTVKVGTSLNELALDASGMRLVTRLGDSTINLWDLTAPATGPPGQQHAGAVTSVSISNDGRRAISCGGGSALLWDLSADGTATEIQTGAANASSAALSADGGWAIVGCDDGSFVKWRTDGSASPAWTDGTVDNPVDAVAIAPNGRSIVGSAEGPAAIWEATKRVDCVLPAQVHLLMVATLGSHGFLAACESGELLVWDANGTAHTPLRCPTAIRSLSVNERGTFAVTRDAQGRIQRWRLRGGKCREPI